MIERIKATLRYFKWILSRSELAIRLLKLSKLDSPVDAPGLVMVQIDGLSLTQFTRALDKRRMPFLKSLIHRERYELYPFYSGLPANTPAVQAEIMYGVKGCVPSFYFVDRQLGRKVKMMDTVYVEKFEKKLRASGNVGLLTGGSSYSNIFTGAAQEAHFCWGKMGWGGVIHAINPLVFPFLIILYLDIFVRTLVLLVIEFILAFLECVRGTMKGRIFSKEGEFVIIRVLVCVFLRELIVAGVCMDIIRGLPIIHLNFLGYDEQAHCRGPSSRFAHWSLQGIDDAIRRINNVIKESPYRKYDLWVYSDHGQESTTPYVLRFGCTVEDAVEKLFSENPSISPAPGRFEKKFMNSRARLLRRSHKENTVLDETPVPLNFEGRETIVTAMGPLGQIYLNKRLDEEEIDFYARLLVSEVNIPLVMVRRGEHHVVAYTPKGSFLLPDQIADLAEEDHPFLNEFKEDIIRLCHHPDAGEFIISGWFKGESSISFPLEFGAHSGLGREETGAFALLPQDTPVKPQNPDYLRPIDLRRAVQAFLNKEVFRPSSHLTTESNLTSMPESFNLANSERERLKV